MERFKLDAAQPEYDASDPEGYRSGMDRFGPKIGATQMGGSVYELPPGQSICPYHYEYPEEEWLFVLSGRVEVRTPEGEEELGPMEVVCFPFGPDGRAQGHQPQRRDRARRDALDQGRRSPSRSIPTAARCSPTPATRRTA